MNLPIPAHRTGLVSIDDDVIGAVEIVAKGLGVSRYTVYNYIREARV